MEAQEKLTNILTSFPPYTTEEILALSDASQEQLDALHDKGLAFKGGYGYWYPSANLVLDAINHFLETPRSYDEDVDPEEVRKIANLLRCVTLLKWPPDYEGRTAVDVEVVDRTRYHDLPWPIERFVGKNAVPPKIALRSIEISMGILLGHLRHLAWVMEHREEDDR